MTPVEKEHNVALPALIGREHPSAVVRAELDRSLDSHGGLVLISGEPGIGKTSLAREVADVARQRQAAVAVATSSAGDGAPDHWPWIQLVRGLERAATSQQWQAARREVGDALAPLLGQTAATTMPPRVADDAAFRLADAVTTLLVTLTRDRPVVIVLDDLHWADASSLDLLAFVARHTWFERLLIVGTYRDVEIETGDHPLRSSISDLLGLATSVTLTGLDAEGVRALIERVAGRDVDQAVADDVYRLTGGNPFFVEQLTRLRTTGGNAEGIPAGVSDTVEARLAILPEAVRELLRLAAVIGREFDRSLLCGTSGRTAQDVDGLISYALAARLVNKLHEERYVFVHDLVREALIAGTSAQDLRRLHADVVAGLDRIGEQGMKTSVGTVARHAYLAVPEIRGEIAAEHLQAAAQDAWGRQAPDEVATHLHRALELFAETSPELRGELLLELGAAERSAGALDRARTTYEQVLKLGRQAGAPCLFGQAVLGLHGLGIPDSDSGTDELPLLDEAHAWLVAQGREPCDPLAVKVLAATSRIRTHLGIEQSEAAERSERALGLARRCSDDGVLAFSLLARHDAIWEPGTAPQRMQLCEEMRDVARRSRDDDLRLEASLLRIVAQLELGEPDAFVEFDALEADAERLRSPRFEFTARSRRGLLATLGGDFATAREAIDHAYVLGEELGEVDRTRLWLEQRWALALFEGDDAEVDRLLELYTLHNPDYRLPALLTAGWREDEAAVRRLVLTVELRDEVYARPFTGAKLCMLAEMASATRDQAWLDDVYRQLLPFRNLWAVVGGGAVYGPYAFWIARLDSAAGRWDDAVAGFQTARDSADRLGAQLWSVEARVRLAEALLERDASGDAVMAASLLDEAISDGGAIGMHATVQRADRTVARVVPCVDSAPQSPDETTAGDQIAEFRFDGHIWRLAFAGETVQVPNAKGLRDLHTLLGLPGEDVAVADLINPSGGKEVRASVRLSADDVLDQRAKAEYRQRLTRLDEQIDAALTRNDDDRAAELDVERDALLEELRTATGFGGRPRRLGDETERARKTVTARIRDTLRRLDERHPELAEHLRASVTTGVACSYRPTREVQWHL